MLALRYLLVEREFLRHCGRLSLVERLWVFSRQGFSWVVVALFPAFAQSFYGLSLLDVCLIVVVAALRGDIGGVECSSGRGDVGLLS